MFKKGLLGLLAFIVILGLSLPNIAKAEEPVEETVEVEETPPVDQLFTPVQLSNTEKESLRQLGFTEDEIDTMSLEEFNKYKNLNGQLLTTDASFYKVVSNLSGTLVTATRVTEKEALAGSNPPPSGNGKDVIKPPVVPMASDTQTTSWLKMTTSSSKLSNGNIQLKNSFKWLKQPNITLTDVVGISHSASAVKVPGTEGFAYKYTDGKGTHTLGAKSTTRNSYGIAKKFNLKGIGSNAAPYNHNGYISVQVKKGNKNDIRANAYGNYTHITVGFAGTIDIRTGNISVGGNIKKSEMEDTMILFNY